MLQIFVLTLSHNDTYGTNAKLKREVRIDRSEHLKFRSVFEQKLKDLVKILSQRLCNSHLSIPFVPYIAIFVADLGVLE